LPFFARPFGAVEASVAPAPALIVFGLAAVPALVVLPVAACFFPTAEVLAPFARGAVFAAGMFFLPFWFAFANPD
jgi:hypothetical protein